MSLYTKITVHKCRTKVVHNCRTSLVPNLHTTVVLPLILDIDSHKSYVSVSFTVLGLYIGKKSGKFK